MSKKREILRLLDLGLSQRAIASAARVSPNKVSEMRQFCTKRNLAYSEALKLSDEEIDGEKKKEERTCGVRRPNCSYIHEKLNHFATLSFLASPRPIIIYTDLNKQAAAD